MLSVYDVHMSGVLYRKYRSQTFDELTGQEHITTILKNGIKKSSVSHAYLFVGSRGTGKTSTARIFAKALNCSHTTKEGNPCNKCSTCVAISNGSFLDMIEIDAASNRGIDQIRDLKEKIEFSPSEGRYKVYVIDEVHMLTTEAFNALLKTLEEPPGHVVFILATTEAHKIPATILSRCQRYDFRLGTEQQIADLVLKTAEKEGVKLSDGALKVLVSNANGSYRDVLSLLDVVVSGQVSSDKPDEVSESEVRKILGVPDSTMVYFLLEKLVFGETVAALEMIGELDNKGVNLQQFVKYVLVALREILISNLKAQDHAEFSFAKSLTRGEVIKLINLFIDADRKLRAAPIPPLVLETIVAEFASQSPGKGELPANDNNDNSNGNDHDEGKGTDEFNELGDNKFHKVDSGDKTHSSKRKSEGKSRVKVIKKQMIHENTSKDGIAKPTDRLDSTNAKISFNEIEQKWSEFTSHIKEFNGHLYAFLRSAKLIAFEDGFLSLDVAFDFHKDRIESAKSREAIIEATKEIYGFAMPVRCNVNSSMQAKRKVSADVILKNIPDSQIQSNSDKRSAYANGKRRSNPEVDKIFADM